MFVIGLLTQFELASGSSRDRHLRRCRQKQLTGTIPRKKSCTLCTQAKTRCDLRTPACSRCKTKGLDCRYYYSPATYKDPALSPIPTLREEISLPTPAATDIGHIDDANGANFDTSLDVAVVDWGEISNSLLDWAPMFGLPEPGATGLEVSPSMPSEGSKTIHAASFSQNSMMGGGQSRVVSQPSRLVSLESFMQMRHRLATEPMLATEKSHFDKFHFMHLVIRAYPKMMVTGNSLPPFIHWSSLVPGRTSEALANCKGLVEMYRTMTVENRQFVMKTIAQEHERVVQQVLAHIKYGVPGQTDLVSVVYFV